MSADDNLVDESVDDGIPPNFLNEFLDDIDTLSLKVNNEQIAQERLKKFNEAWNIPSSNAEQPSTSDMSYEPQPGTSASSFSPTMQEKLESNDLSAQTTNHSLKGGLLGLPSSLQIVEDAPRPSTSTDGLRGRLPTHSSAANGGRRSDPRRRSYSEDDDDDAEEDGCEYRQRRAVHSRRHRSRYRPRSRSPPESRRMRRFRSRTPPRSRSRFGSRSPRRRQRSRTPRRSRSFSRDSRSSQSSERERPMKRRNYRPDPPAIEAAPVVPAVQNVAMLAQSMMAMMQMFNQCTNSTQPGLPVQFGNLVQTASAGLPPPVLMNPLALSTPANAGPMPSANPGCSSQTHREQPRTNDTGKDPQYDFTTELFLEGKMHFGQYLRENPPCMAQQRVKPKVSERIKEAISILERQETKEQMVKFLYVPPYYYSVTRKKENRSPLICNDRNVLLGLTSCSREVKNCEPFDNVNGKLKGLIVKLGLDEGAISQQLQRNALAAVNNAIAERGSSSRIQAISTLPPKPGSTKVRHMIERAAQTEGYACGECVERVKKTFVSCGSQTMSTVSRKANAASQTPVLFDQNPFAPSISLENLTASQVETIEAIVKFIRTRHVTGPVDAVQHALSKDSTARITMGHSMFQTARDVMSMMTDDDPRPSTSSYASSSGSNSRYVVSIQQHVQTNRQVASTSFHPRAISPPTPPTAGGRYFQAFNSQTAIVPACYAPSQPRSRFRKRGTNKKRDHS